MIQTNCCYQDNDFKYIFLIICTNFKVGKIYFFTFWNSKLKRSLSHNLSSWPAERPHRAWAVDKIRRSQPMQSGPKFVHFGKIHSKDPNIGAQIFYFKIISPLCWDLIKGIVLIRIWLFVQLKKLDIVGKWFSVKKTFFGFYQKFAPITFHFCLWKLPNTGKQGIQKKKWKLSLGCCFIN